MKGKMLSTTNRIDMIIEYAEKYSGNYLEIGCYHGQSLCAVAQSLHNRICYGIDPFLGDVFTHPQIGDEESSNGKRFDFSVDNPLYENISHFKNIKFFNRTTEQFMTNLTQNEIDEMNITSFYIDGCHHYDYVMYDAKSCMRLLNNKNGVIIFDDTHNDEVKQAYDDFIQHLEQSGVGYHTPDDGVIKF